MTEGSQSVGHGSRAGRRSSHRCRGAGAAVGSSPTSASSSGMSFGLITDFRVSQRIVGSSCGGRHSAPRASPRTRRPDPCRRPNDDLVDLLCPSLQMRGRSKHIIGFELIIATRQRPSPRAPPRADGPARHAGQCRRRSCSPPSRFRKRLDHMVGGDARSVTSPSLI